VQPQRCCAGINNNTIQHGVLSGRRARKVLDGSRLLPTTDVSWTALLSVAPPSIDPAIVSIEFHLIVQAGELTVRIVAAPGPRPSEPSGRAIGVREGRARCSLPQHAMFIHHCSTFRPLTPPTSSPRSPGVQVPGLESNRWWAHRSWRCRTPSAPLA
jgi:hypothetical protein